MSESARFSGRLSLRIPRSLHGELARAAEAEGVSINKLLLPAIASVVDWGTPRSSVGPTSLSPAPERQGKEMQRRREPDHDGYERTWDRVSKMLVDPQSGEELEE